MTAGKTIIKNIFSLSVAEISRNLIYIIYLAYLARVLNPDGFGIIGFANSFTAYFLLLVALGLETYGTREVSKHPALMRKYVNNIVSLRLILSVAIYSIFSFVIILLNKPAEVKIVMLISGFNLFANAILLNWVFQAIEKMEVIAVRQILTSLLNLAGVVLLIHDPGDTAVAMGVIIGSALLNSLLMLFYYKKLYGKIKFEYSYSVWLTTMKGAITLGLTFFVVMIYNNIDMVMLGFMRSDRETGIYNAAVKLMLLAAVPLGILQNAFFPNFSKCSVPKDSMSILQRYSTFSFSIGTFLPFILIAYSDFIVKTVWGIKYVETSYVQQILMVTVIFKYIVVTYTCPLIAWNREKQILLAIVAGAVLNVVANLALIPLYGVYGASIATLACEMLVAVMVAHIFRKIIGRIFFPNFIRLLFISLVPCLAGWTAMQFGMHPMACIIISISLFCVASLLFKTITISDLKRYLLKGSV